MKTLEQNFADWESNAFGFGYGTGEEHTLRALKRFFDQISQGRDNPNAYDYQILEQELGPTVAWLMINALLQRGQEVLEYGASPRYGWLTPEGETLKAFVDAHSVAELVDICCDRGEDYIVCYPDCCNCGPDGYNPKAVCPNLERPPLTCGFAHNPSSLPHHPLNTPQCLNPKPEEKVGDVGRD